MAIRNFISYALKKKSVNPLFFLRSNHPTNKTFITQNADSESNIT